MRRPIYATRTGMRMGPVHSGADEYYARQSYLWHASEEARVNVLLADLNRANARLNTYLVACDRVFYIEEQRIAAIFEAGFETAGRSNVEILLKHSILNRKAMAKAYSFLPSRLDGYAYAAKRARIDLPNDDIIFNVEAELSTLSLGTARLASRIEELDQQISDLLSAADMNAEVAPKN
jgi:hypothetical protein